MDNNLEICKNYLVIGAIIIEGHVQGLSNTRSLGEAGIPVYVVDKANCIARYSRYCKKFFLCPDFIEDEFADFLIELALKENIKDWVLIPSNDHAVYTLSKYKSKLELYYKVITPGLDVIDNIYDKLRLLEIAQQHGVPIPVTQNFLSEADPVDNDLRFPVITKGRNGLSFYRTLHKKAMLAADETELREQLQWIGSKYPIGKTFTQELIPFDGSNKTISFTAFCVEGEIKTYWMGVKLREHPLRFGTATFAQSVYVEDCYTQSLSLLKALKYTGVCEVEYLLDPRDSKYKLIEINARTWLWVGLAKACGVDYAKMIYNYINKMPLEYPANYDLNVKWINHMTDSFMVFQLILKRQLTPLHFIKSISGKKVKAVFQLRDPFPGVALLFMSLYLIKKRIY